MEVRYQRDLYRVQLCCDTKKEEKELGYPLQMCLRNEIDGLLPCQIQGIDGQVTVCWDVTSRQSIVKMTGDGQLETAVLHRILTALQKTMTEMERYLLPCECLVLDPSLIFLKPAEESVSFFCDFENMQSFHDSVSVLGEYVLAHMNHCDREAMRLGYGLYRLTVEEAFDRKALMQLCEDEKRTVPQNTEYEYLPKEEGEKKEAVSERQTVREQTLEAFFSEEEDAQEKCSAKGYVLCGGCILAGILLMELVVYFRNGRHLSVGWICTGAGLFVLAAGMVTVLQYILRKKEPEETEEKDRNSIKDTGTKNRLYTNRARMTECPVYTEPSVYPHEKEENQETVVLSHSHQTETEVAAIVFPDGRKEYLKGSHWLIGKNRKDVDICLLQPTVSRLHACIMKKDGGYYLEDLNSKNGTYLGQNSLKPGQLYLLEPGQRICFADQCCEFCVEKTAV